MTTILLIAGIDPGTTTGIALLNLNGQLIASTSRKEFSKSSITRYIISNGKPLLIATDVYPPPSTVEKIASSFGAVLYSPGEDLKQQEKDSLTSSFNTSNMDSHAQDALAAAEKAYRENKSLIEKIQRKAEQAQLTEQLDTLVEQAFKSTKSTSQIIQEFQQEEDKNQKEQVKKTTAEQKDWETIAERYRQQLQQKEKETSRLRDYKNQLETQNTQLTQENKRLKTDAKKEILEKKEVKNLQTTLDNRKKQIQKLEKNVSQLKHKLRRHNKALQFLSKGETLFPICTSENDLQQQKHSIAFIARNLQAPPPSSVKIVILESQEDRQYYQDKDIKTVHYQDLKGLKLDNFFIVNQQHVREHVKNDAEQFLEWVEQYRSRQ